MHDDPGPMLSAVRAASRRLPMARRSSDLELLDAGSLADDELERNLADLERLNRLPGGATASIAAIARLLCDGQPADVVDVGTGRGDLPLAFVQRAWRVTGVEADAAVARIARRVTAGSPGIRIVEADARSLPFPDGAFDVAHCSLLLHHLDPPTAVRVLAEMGRVARRGVVVNDLRRGILPLLATATAVAALARCRTTCHDGLLSVRRAYRIGELDALLAAGGFRVVDRSPSWMPRVVTTVVGVTG